MDQEEKDRLANEIRALGERATPIRLQVLHHLRQAARALSHAEVEERIEQQADRVTLYRTLDWLVAKGLAHRSMDEHRVARYSPSVGSQLMHEGHAHFECDHCGKVYCLDEVTPVSPRLPQGYKARDVQLFVHGACSVCASEAKQAKPGN